jgi:hypothetical protein
MADSSFWMVSVAQLFYLLVYLKAFIQEGIERFYGGFIWLQLLIFLASRPAAFIQQKLLLMLVYAIQLTISLSKIIFKFSFINLLAYPFVHSKSFFFVHSIVSLIDFFIVLPNAVSVPNPMLEIAFISTSI